MKELLELLLVFLKLGLFTFGGGYAMIPQIKEIVIDKKHWLTEDELLEVIAISESTPGPMAINLATYIGFKKRKFFGALFSTIGVIIPSFIIILIISLIFDKFISNKYVSYAFVGIKCAVAILIISAALDMLKKIEKNAFNICLIIIVCITLILLEIFQIKFSSIFLILIGGMLGIILCVCKKEKAK